MRELLFRDGAWWGTATLGSLPEKTFFSSGQLVKEGLGRRHPSPQFNVASTPGGVKPFDVKFVMGLHIC